jgi:hypothetical protein
VSDRAKDFMSKIWEVRNNGADTEEKLVAGILRVAAEGIRMYQAHDNLILLDRNDLVVLANEIENLK